MENANVALLLVSSHWGYNLLQCVPGLTGFVTYSLSIGYSKPKTVFAIGKYTFKAVFESLLELYPAG